jgi:hypothetical protein
LISEATKAIVRDRSSGVCEVCLAVPATNFHHRRARGMGGTKRNIHGPDWVLHLCGSGTTGCHGYIESHPEISYAKGWKIRGTHTPATIPVELHGEWLILQPDGTARPHRWTPDG